MNYFYVFLGGGLGSLARFLVSKGSVSLWGNGFPWGTFISNMAACGILAALVLWINSSDQIGSWVQPMLIVGFCGGFSTFSTFSKETLELIQANNWGFAIANVLISVAVGVGLIYALRAKL